MLHLKFKVGLPHRIITTCNFHILQTILLGSSPVYNFFPSSNIYTNEPEWLFYAFCQGLKHLQHLLDIKTQDKIELEIQVYHLHTADEAVMIFNNLYMMDREAKRHIILHMDLHYFKLLLSQQVSISLIGKGKSNPQSHATNKFLWEWHGWSPCLQW